MQFGEHVVRTQLPPSGSASVSASAAFVLVAAFNPTAAAPKVAPLAAMNARRLIEVESVCKRSMCSPFSRLIHTVLQLFGTHGRGLLFCPEGLKLVSVCANAHSLEVL